MLRSLIPSPSLEDKSHVVDICPPSLLDVGECYRITPQGWGRGKIVLPEQLVPHDAEPPDGSHPHDDA